MSKINWFDIDMVAFQSAYDKYLETCKKHEKAVNQRKACEEGICMHDRKLRKDSNPDKRYPCPEGHYWYNQECNTGNSLYFDHAHQLFKNIGIGYEFSDDD